MFERVRRALSAAATELRGIKVSAANYLSSKLHQLYSTSDAGVTVTPSTAMTLSAVWSCTRILSETPASLPFELRRKLPNGGSEVITDHPASALCEAPNPEMTWFNFLEAHMNHVVNWGNWYDEIERDSAGFPLALWPMLPDRTWPERNKATRQIQYRTIVGDGPQIILPSPNVLHVVGMGFDGLCGYSVITMARNSLGMTAAAEQVGAALYRNGIRPSGTFETDSELGPVAFERLQEAIEANKGLSNMHRTLILEQGLKWKQTTISPEDAQFLESRQFQVTEVCRWYRVPPHLVYDLTRSTNNNIEQQSLEANIFTFRPWYVRIEKAFNRRLLTKDDRAGGLYFHFNANALLRGDMKSRYEAYAIGRQGGWESANSILSLEDRNPIEGGDLYLVPSNMTTPAKLSAPDPVAPEPQGDLNDRPQA